jgi:hypothetical protein
MNNEPKFCVNCRWFNVGGYCDKSASFGIDLVYGGTLVHRKECKIMRKEECGPDAKLWEEKV